jgi:hypothetical protein
MVKEEGSVIDNGCERKMPREFAGGKFIKENQGVK